MEDPPQLLVSALFAALGSRSSRMALSGGIGVSRASLQPAPDRGLRQDTVASSRSGRIKKTGGASAPFPLVPSSRTGDVISSNPEEPRHWVTAKNGPSLELRDPPGTVRP